MCIRDSKWTINANENNNYQNKLDEALLNQDSAADDDKVDIFLIEADYALKLSLIHIWGARSSAPAYPLPSGPAFWCSAARSPAGVSSCLLYTSVLDTRLKKSSLPR